MFLSELDSNACRSLDTEDLTEYEKDCDKLFAKYARSDHCKNCRSVNVQHLPEISHCSKFLKLLLLHFIFAILMLIFIISLFIFYRNEILELFSQSVMFLILLVMSLNL